MVRFSHDVAVSNAKPFNFSNTYVRLPDRFFVRLDPTPVQSPELVHLNTRLAEHLGIESDHFKTEQGVRILSGNAVPTGAEPLAMAYAGHQFGGFSPQLGDGRALLLGEVIDTQQHRRDIQLKGSGRTPFSRGGDGKAAVGPVLREYLIGEAMYALGVPTTRALAAIATGKEVYRENILPGAILTRVAASHIRVGTFQYGAARGNEDKVRKLADYAIARHYPDTADAENPYLAFFAAVVDAQAALVAQWMSIGFIHGVMNTDNMTISGETIDYGPCAFMENYNPGTVFSSIDQGGRYSYANQPQILVWNLARLAEPLIPLVDPNQERAVELLTETIECIQPLYESYWLTRMRSKIGLSKEDSLDSQLIQDLLKVMEGTDFTLAFRRLSQVLCGDRDIVKNLFKKPNEFDDWEQRWAKRLKQEGVATEETAQAMDRVNPIYIPRNHKVEEALAAATHQADMTAFSKLLTILTRPFEEVEGNEAYAEPAPATNMPYRTFCGT